MLAADGNLKQCVRIPPVELKSIDEKGHCTHPQNAGSSKVWNVCASNTLIELARDFSESRAELCMLVLCLWRRHAWKGFGHLEDDHERPKVVFASRWRHSRLPLSAASSTSLLLCCSSLMPGGLSAVE